MCYSLFSQSQDCAMVNNFSVNILMCKLLHPQGFLRRTRT